MKRASLLLALFLITHLFGCRSHEPEVVSPDSSASTVGAEQLPSSSTKPPMLDKAVVEAQNNFGLEVHTRLAPEHPNLVVSPLSTSLALGMLQLGARGKTEAEMEDTLGVTSASLPGQGRVCAEMQSGAGVDINIANRVWLQAGAEPSLAYLQATKENFGGDAGLVNFEASEEARKTINGWVSDKTHDKIPELFAKGILDANTELVLTNAIHFKGAWKAPFDPKETVPMAFNVSASDKLEVPMMQATRTMSLASGADASLLELPYEGDTFSMLVLLPAAVDGLAEVERGLDGASLKARMEKLERRRVALSLPRFSAESSIEMSRLLIDMGMPSAFDEGSANLTGIRPEGGLFVSNVIHKARIDVNEEGAEAAAASGAALKYRSLKRPPEPVLFVVDRPFFFAIVHKPTRAIVFAGRVSRPESLK